MRSSFGKIDRKRGSHIIHAPFTDGPLDASIILIGQAPGRDENAHGGAFIGPAGKALTRFCASAGINKETCRLENLFQFFPDNDDLSPYIKLGTKRAVETEIYRAHKEALRQRLLRTSANILVPLGAISNYALTGIVGRIGKWRGSVLESTLLPGKKCLPTYHPASILKGEYLNGYYITYDLLRVKQQSAYPEIRRLRRDLVTNPSFGEACAFLRECRTASRIAYDIETRGHYLSHISFALSPTRAICIALIDGAKDTWLPEEEAELLRLIAQLLEDENVEKIGQNLSFDCSFLYRHYGINVHPVQDTMIAAAILFPDFPKGLDFLVSLYCDGEPYYKDDGKVWKTGTFGDEATFRRYNAMDSAVILQIFPRQVEELRRIKNWDTYVEQKELIHPLVYASDRGILIDVKGMKKASELCEQQIEQLEVELREIVGPDINIDSTTQLIQYFYVQKRIKPYVKRRKSGDSTPTVDEKALTRLASYGYKEAKLLLEIRKLKKMQSTYYRMGVDDDNRIRCSYNPVGTVQARISSSASIWGTGGNFQNLPEDVLILLRADPGGLYVTLDESQAENRVIAYEAQEMKMIEALEAGVDIHVLTASLIHEVSVEQVTKEMRADGKVANFGLNFGLGIENFIIRYELEREQGKFIWNRYHQVYPGIHEWHERIKEELQANNRVLVNCYGRARRFLDLWGSDLFEKAYNFRPQSIVATKMNKDGVKFVYYRQDLFKDVEFVNTVHDSIWLWIPLDRPHHIIDVALQVKQSLEQPLIVNGRSFSIPTDIKIGLTLEEDKMLSWKASETNFSDRSKLEEELDTYVSKATRGLD